MSLNAKEDGELSTRWAPQQPTVQDIVDNFFEEFKPDVNFKEFKELANVTKEFKATTSLEEAVSSFQVGNEAAFDFLYHHYERPIKNLGHRMHDDDLASELFIVLLRSAKRFKSEYNVKFNTYFWRGARNHIGSQRNMRRAQKRGGIKFKHLIDPDMDLDIDGQRDVYKQFDEQKPKKTYSLNVKASVNNSSGIDTEMMEFIEDESALASYTKTTTDMALNTLLNNGMLKPKEIAAIRLLWENSNITLEAAGEMLGDITAPAVHVLLRRIANKPIAPQLREILLSH